MKESDFASVFGSKTIAPFQRQFHLGIQALDNAAGKLLFGLKIVEKQSPVVAEGTCDFFQGFELAFEDFATPGVQELSSMSRRQAAVIVKPVPAA